MTETYAYDPLRRLTGVNDSEGFQATYEYDAAGNRTRWWANHQPVNVGLPLDGNISADGFKLTIDPVSGEFVTTAGINGSMGVGAGADVALTGGIPYMNYSWLLWSMQLPGSGD